MVRKGHQLENPGRCAGKAGAETPAKDSPVCAGVRKRVCTLYGGKIGCRPPQGNLRKAPGDVAGPGKHGGTGQAFPAAL